MPASIPRANDLEKLRADGSATLYRGAADSEGAALLVLVASADADSVARGRLEREFEHRDVVQPDWSALPTMLVADGRSLQLYLSDPGGVLLSRWMGLPWDVSRFLTAAVAISNSVGKMHRAGLIHRDLKPGNIFIDLEERQAWLTGFAIASRLPREHEAFGRPERLAGTLAYMSPEQTGHMNRSIDSRSDLYALGIIFYEMLAGSLPFSAAEPLEWIHCHVARLPERLAERRPSIPERLSAVVMRLLAKTGEERYQTAEGLEADLRRCLADWTATGQLTSFPLGGRDNAGRLAVPEKLYGRDQDVARLGASFERVRTSGRPELTLVSGYSGIGKSSLVNELHRRLVLPKAFFVAGKFDLLHADAPYSMLAEAFRDQLRRILASVETEIVRWRRQLGQAVGSSGAVLLEVMPELEVLLGPQDAPPVLSPAEASVRFRNTLAGFVLAFARPEHPLVLFMDDLQWQDPASLAFMQHLACHPECRHLHLIGAYRDNEIGPAHPLLATIAAIEGRGIAIERIVLEALGLDDVNQLVGDALRTDMVSCRSLAEVVYTNTGGNPFFAGQFLADAAEQNLLRFQPQAQRWTWDIPVVAARGYTDNLADLMIRRIWRLPEATQEALKLLSCFGSGASSRDLALVGGGNQVVDEDFRAAVEAGVVQVRDGEYRFAHDRVQEAAYAVVPEDSRARMHLNIGMALANSLPAGDGGDRVFDIANQLNAGRLALASVAERTVVATLNLKAGVKAKAATAYEAACGYLQAGSEILGDDAWHREYDLAFNLRFELAECEISRVRVDDASALVETLIERANSKVDSARAYVLRMTLQLMRGDVEKIVPTALEGLALLGHSFPPNPGSDELQAEYQSMRRALGDRPIESLVELPLIQDRETAAATTIMFHVGLAAYFTNANLYLIIACRLVSLTLKHGIFEASTFGFSCVGLSLGPVFHRFEDGERFARASVAITQKSQFRAINAGAYVTLQQALIWTRPVAEAIECLDIALKLAKEAGSLIFACYSVEHKLTDLLFRGDSLLELRRQISDGLSFAEKNQVKHVGDIIASMRGFVGNMVGASDDLAARDDDATERRALSSGIPVVICFHWILQVQRYLVLGDPVRSLEYARQAAPMAWSARNHVQSANYCFYESLAIAACLHREGAVELSDGRARLAINLASLERWSDSCPSSFGHRHALVSAEVARADGRLLEASQLYERAIQAATDNGFQHDRALAYELAAAHSRASGLSSAAKWYLKQARADYLSWGAHAKVALLDEQYPDIERSPPVASSTTIEAALERVDISTIVKVSQTLSGEIVLSNLVEKLMTIAMAHAGAQGGSLLLKAGGEWRLEAVASSSTDRVTVEPRRRLVRHDDLPPTVLSEATRTGRAIVIDDALANPALFRDAYVAQHRPRSIACLPLVAQGSLVGMLYLENNLATQVFTPERHAVLELIASQAAISLQNADLYGRLVRENAERKQSEAALRESQERYALAIAAAADGHADWIAESDTLYASPRFLEQWGLPAELSISRSQQMIERFPFHPEDRSGVVELMETSRASDAKRLEFDTRVIRHGETRWMHVTTLYARDDAGRMLRASIATTDITERMRATEELRTSEERYALALAGANEGIFDLDLVTRSLYLPARTQELIGIVPAGESRRSLAEWRGIVNMPPGDEKRQRVALAKHLAGMSPAYDVELRYIGAAGDVRWVRERGQALRDEAGRPHRLVGSVGDISERKKHEEEMRRLGVRLRQAERFEAMGTLAEGIAHDFNNILGAILGYGERAKRSTTAGTRLHDDIANVLTAGERGRVLVDSVLSFSRGAAGERVPVHVERIVREVLSLLNGKRPPEIRMDVRLEAGRAAILGDATQVHQLVMNLATNSVQAMGAQGTLSVRLGLESPAEQRSAAIGTVSPGSWLVLRVGDTGSGISPETLPRIFDPFFTTKASGVGSGLGLSLVQRIVVQARGAIDVQSEPGAGSVFTVYLPHIGDAPEITDEVSPTVPMGTGQRILVVDDEGPLLELMVDTLREAGYAAEGFTSAAAAIEIFRVDPSAFDVLITDQRMPGMSGDALIRELRRMQPLLPVLLVSGYAGEASFANEDGGAADEVLTKPLRRNALAISVARLLGIS